MKCQKCQKREATTHITEIINGKKQELHLCGPCAAQSSELAGMDFGIGHFLGGLVSDARKRTREGERSGLVCPLCHMPFEAFVQKGRLGCGTCYETFRSRLERPLKQIHGTCEHVGKVPKRKEKDLSLSRRLHRLEEELKQAVSVQEFEKAAKLRDQILALKNQTGEEA